MRKIILPLSVLILAIGCNSEPKGYKVNGTISGELADGTMVFLKRIDENNQPVEIDTAILTKGKFEFGGQMDAPELHYIFVDKTPGYTAVILENGEIDFNAQKDSLGFAKIRGTHQNDVFSDYLDKSRSLSMQAQSIQMDMQRAQNANDQATIASLRDEMEELQNEYKTFELEYIKNNPDALISALLLERAISSKAVESAKIQEMFNALSKEIQDSKPGKRVATNVEKLKKSEEAEKKTAVGAKAPNFSGPTPDGKEIALTDVLGKATLIDFWAAWCRPCRAENPNIVSVYKKYHDKGLNIIGVSLDKSEEAWKKAIADDGLEWNHVSHIAYFNDEIAQQYNVDAIPAAFLLDENGVIVAKNLRGPALEAKVAELLD